VFFVSPKVNISTDAMMGIATPRHCQMKCWAWEECEAFTFSYDQGCFLLTDKLTDVQHDKQESNFATSGPKYCTSDGQQSTEGGQKS